MDHFSHLESTWMSAPAAADDTFALRHLIGKLGNSTAFPPKLHLPILDQISVPPPPPLPSLSADPGFAERAAKFSCFGSRSFNGRRRSSQLVNDDDGKLTRVSSSPMLKRDGDLTKQMRRRPNSSSSNGEEQEEEEEEESSVSEQIPTAHRKRKAISRGKTKQHRSNSVVVKGVDGDEDGNSKRCKKEEEAAAKTTNGGGGGCSEESEKQKTSNQKPPEPPKDYIHVRARRGQATDSHSLAERVRREKISERMKLLQDLVPGCNKVTGKALMLDEIINYVQSLQRQVEFLSMKLASVNPGLDFNNSENHLLVCVSKDQQQQQQMFEQNSTPHQMYPPPLDSPTAPFYQMSPNPVDPHPFDAPSCRNLDAAPAAAAGFNQTLHQVNIFSKFNLTQQISKHNAAAAACLILSSQFPPFTQDDLHTIVHMGGFPHNPLTFPPTVQNQASNMKVEL